jgi:quercetin dioxygenase-like cupin family protein
MSVETYHLDEMFKGWFVGAFTPTCLDTESCEVAVKTYHAGEREDAHFHKVATEITVVVTGSVRMLDKEWTAGDIIKLPPGTITDFEALTDSVNVVVKIPGAKNDKYTCKENPE